MSRMVYVMDQLSRSQREDVGRRMRVDRAPWGMAVWNGVDRVTRERLATTQATYNVLGHHWPACAGVDCDALAVELDADGEFCCAEHEHK